MNENRLIVADTIREACQLWRAHLHLILIIAVAVSIPQVLQILLVQIGGDAWWVKIWGTAVLGVVNFILDALSNAILLIAIVNKGLPTGKAFYDAIDKFGARIVGVHLMVTILGGLVIAFFTFVFLSLHANTGSGVFGFLYLGFAILWVILLKYALADPIVVVENRFAVEALGESWRMTRSHFGYVAGNYIVVALVLGMVGGLSAYCLPAGWPGVLLDEIEMLALSAAQMIWIMLAWCMYRRIKTTKQSASDLSAASEPSSC